ncbi:methyltransferase domain-containing protein [Sphingomonas sp. HF-S3]|uniref:Methyltransferase domain-containing protein n=1 Tax=Sphingomonas rustica TaxID=3103142 RepID=A0ABV0BAG3_9SPHN
MFSVMSPAGVVRPAFAADSLRSAILHGSVRRARADRRWPAIERLLFAMRKAGRRSIRIVDAGCGAGDLLIQAARHARSIGFLAIEGRGIDRDPAAIARARSTAKLLADPAIGLSFESGYARAALADEAEAPADLILYSRSVPAEVARSAGKVALAAEAVA